MSNLNLIKYTDYDNKDYLMLQDENVEFTEYKLSDEEKLSLVNINLLKTEVSYMCRYDTPNGGVQYELAREKRNTMHDDRAYTAAMAAFALAKLRRTDLVKKDKVAIDLSHYQSLSRSPTVLPTKY